MAKKAVKKQVEVAEPTEEQAKRWKSAYWSTFHAIAADADIPEDDTELELEVTLDAGHVRIYGGLSKEEYEHFDNWVQKHYHQPGQVRLREVFYARK